MSLIEIVAYPLCIIAVPVILYCMYKSIPNFSKKARDFEKYGLRK